AVDLAEFFQRPHRTGIQRVGAELCLAWANQEQVKPVMCAPDGALLALQPEAFFLLSNYFRAADIDSEAANRAIRTLAQVSLEQRRRFIPAPSDIVVVPEVFFDPSRIGFYSSALRR